MTLKRREKEPVKTVSIVIACVLVLALLLTSAAASGDSYEPDDSYTEATPIEVGSTQAHDFTPAGDADWLVFNAAAEADYTVYTSNLGQNSGTNIYLYHSLSGFASPLDSYTGGGAGSITWTVDNTALIYYIQLNNTNKTASGPTTSYSVSLTQPTPTPTPTLIPTPTPTSYSGARSDTTSTTGGGGGGGVAVEDYRNVLEREKHDAYIYQNKTVSYAFKRNSIVTRVSFTGKTNYGEAIIQVEVLKNIPGSLKLKPPGEVYRYFNVRIGSSGFSSARDLEIWFKIKKAWASDKKTVKLLQFDGRKWNEASTVKTGEDSSYIYFKGSEIGLHPYYTVIAPGEEPLKTASPAAAHPGAVEQALKTGKNEKNAAEDTDSTDSAQESPGFTAAVTFLAALYAYLQKKRS